MGSGGLSRAPSCITLATLFFLLCFCRTWIRNSWQVSNHGVAMRRQLWFTSHDQLQFTWSAQLCSMLSFSATMFSLPTALFVSLTCNRCSYCLCCAVCTIHTRTPQLSGAEFCPHGSQGCFGAISQGMPNSNIMYRQTCALHLSEIDLQGI